MSQRVMTLLEEMAPTTEVYSIECFADLTGLPGDLVRVGREMRARVLRCTGIPIYANQVSSRRTCLRPSSPSGPARPWR
jgi:DNA polymerase V